MEDFIKQPDPIKTVVLYHANCNDGFGAAYAHWYWDNMSNNTVYYPMQYGDKIPACINKETDVIFLDFALSLEATEELCKQAKSVTVIDHHKTSQCLSKVEAGNFVFFHDLNRSGAILAWDVLRLDDSKQPPLTLRFIQDRDLWKFNLPDTKAFHAGFASFPRDFDSFDTLSNNPIQVIKIIEQGYAILGYRDTVLESLMKESAIDTIKGHTAILVNCPPILSSDMAETVFEAYPQAKIAILFNMQSGKIKYSLRSNGKVDVEEIAKHYGGGGHANAASFTMPIEESHFIKGL